MARRCWRALRGGAVVLALVVPVAWVLPSANAYAATPRTHNYSKAWTFVSAPLGVCVKFEVLGSITYDFSPSGVNGGAGNWYNIEVQSPEVEAFVYYFDGRACWNTIPETATGIAMMQAWSGYNCNFDPSFSISASFPSWGVSVKGWPSCGNRVQASRGNGVHSTATVYQQFNSGGVFSLSDYSYQGRPSIGPCYGVRVTGTVYEGPASDSFTSGSDSVCIT
jgi:hypothetical protein